MNLCLKKYVKIFFYSFILIIFDLLLHIFVGGNHYNLFHIITYDLFIGITFFSLLSKTYKVTRTVFIILIDIIVIFYVLLIMVQIFCYRSLSNLFPIKTVFMNAKDVLLLYKEDISVVLKNNLILFIFMVLLLICFIYLTIKIYLKDNEEVPKKYSMKMVLITSLLAFIGVFSINDNIIGWTDNLKTNGIKAAIANDLSVNNNYKFVYDDIDETESIEVDIKEEENDKETNIYNMIDYDFEALMANENRDEFNEINKYIKSKTPTKKNDYTGLFKGKNLILICAEAFNSNIVDEELFPTMYRLINNGFKLNNFYQPMAGSSTSSGEYAFTTGMIPTSTDYSFIESAGNDMGFTISKKLKELNYNSISFHNAHSNFYGRDITHVEHMGFDKFYAFETGMEKITGRGFPDDKLMIDKSIDIFDKDEPFLAYYMTYTAHKPYDKKIQDMIYSNYYSKVYHKYGDKYSFNLINYIARNMYLEEGLSILLSKLEEKNIINDTVICLVPDHYPYGLRSYDQDMKDSDLEALYGTKEVLYKKELLDKTYPILWCGSLENEDKEKRIDVDKLTCSIDITPTLLNLFGIEYDSRLYPGRDIFDDNEGIVIYQDGRYIYEDGVHRLSQWAKKDKMTKTDYYVLNAINYCRFNIKEDYYAYINNKEKINIKYAYLTFEGGPTDSTEKIIDVLESNNVSACFFVTGDKKMDLIEKMISNGNSIGVYSLTSNINMMYKDDETFINSVKELISYIQNLKYTPVVSIRFPSGSKKQIIDTNKPGLIDRCKIHIKNMNIKYLDFNVDGKDENNTNKDIIVNNIREGIKDKNEVWIKLHDDENSYNTVEALQEIIDILKEEGFIMRAWDIYCHVYHSD